MVTSTEAYKRCQKEMWAQPMPVVVGAMGRKNSEHFSLARTSLHPVCPSSHLNIPFTSQIRELAAWATSGPSRAKSPQLSLQKPKLQELPSWEASGMHHLGATAAVGACAVPSFCHHAACLGRRKAPVWRCTSINSFRYTTLVSISYQTNQMNRKRERK